MDKRIHKKNEKVIYYPGLVKRLIEKGMEALKEKDGETAYNYFLEAEEHDNEHPQVLFGKMLSLVELGRLQEALEHTARLLYEGIGDYFDTLQVHISLLVQLGRYEEVVDLISAVLSEHRVPAHMAESFYQLLYFSRQMVEMNVLEYENEEHALHVDEAIEMLHSSSLEVQLRAITLLKNNEDEKATKALVTYVQSPCNDLALLSIALRALHEKKYNGHVHIEKNGRKMVVKPSELDDLFKGSFAKKVLAILQKHVEQDNPFLFELARQLCFSHLLAIYPFLPEQEDENLWAGVFHYCAAERLGLEDELEKVINLYALDTEIVHKLKREVEQLEANVFQVRDLIQ